MQLHYGNGVVAHAGEASPAGSLGATIHGALTAALVGAPVDAGLAAGSQSAMRDLVGAGGSSSALVASSEAAQEETDGFRAQVQRVVDRLSAGLGLAGVAVHTDASAITRTRSAGTRGLADRRDVYLDPTRFDPASVDGRGLIAHELAHVAQAALPAADTPLAAGIAEGEAAAFADRFASGGTIGAVAHGLPASHTAAESGGGVEPIDPAQLPALDIGEIDLDREVLLARFTEDLDGVLGELVVHPGFVALAEERRGASTSEQVDGESPEGSTGESDTSAGESDTSAGESDTSADAETSEEGETCEADPLAELREAPAFQQLTAICGRLYTDDIGGVVVELQGALASGVQAAALDDAELELLEELVLSADAAAMEASSDDGQCADPDAEADLFGAIPVDPATEFDLGECAVDDAVDEEPPGTSDQELPDVDTAPDDPVGESPGGSAGEEEAEEPGVCETVPELASTVPDAVPAAPATESLRQLDPGELDEIDAVCAMTDEITAGEGTHSALDRAGDVLVTFGSSALEPFAGAFMKQLGDTLILDTMGVLLDKGLSKVLLRFGKTGAAKVPAIGPVLTVLLPALQFAADPDGWAEAQFEELKGSGEDFGQAVDEFRAAWAALAQGDLQDTASHNLEAQAEIYGGLTHLCTFLAGLCGVLAAVLFVVGWGVIFTGVGAAAAPACLAAAKFLAEACTLLGMLALGFQATATLFSALAALFAPVERYEEQQKELADASAALGEQAGAFAGDAVGAAASQQLAVIGDSSQRSAGGEQRPADDSGGGEALEEGRARAAEAQEELQRRVDEHATDVEDHVARAEGEVPADAPDGAAAPDGVSSWRDKAAAFLGKVKEGLPTLGNIVEQGRKLEAAYADAKQLAASALDQGKLEGLEQTMQQIRADHEALGRDIEATRSSIAEARAEIDQLVGGGSGEFEAGPMEGDASFVQDLTQVHAELADHRRTLDDQAARMQSSSQQLWEAHQALEAERVRAARDAELASETVDMQDDDLSPDKVFAEDSSGNATGGVGSIYLEYLDFVIELVSGEATAAEAHAGETRDLAQDVALAAGRAEQAASMECAVDPAEADPAEAYWLGHSDEILEDVGYLDAELPESLQVYADGPGVDLETMAEAAEEAETAYDAFLEEQAAAYAAGQMETFLEAAESQGPSPDDVAVLRSHADQLDAEIDQVLADTDRAEASFSELPGDLEAPDGLMEQLGAADALVGEHGELATGAPEEVEIPEQDPAAGAAEAGALVEEQRARVGEQRAQLQAQQQAVEGVNQEIGAHEESLQAGREPLREAREEAARTREASQQAAETRRAEAEAASNAAVDDIGALSSWKARVEASQESE